MNEGQRTKPVIVVADDEAHIRLVVADRFKSAGYEVIQAADGEEALEAVQTHLPDVVVTDLQMPYMSGLELCTRLAMSPRTAGIPAVMLTARGHIVDPETIGKTIIRTVMAKPFGVKELVRVVEELIGAGHKTGTGDPVRLTLPGSASEAA